MKNVSNVSIKVKIAGAVVGCLVVIAVANAVLARYNYEQDMRYAADLAVKAAAQSFIGIEQREVDKLSTALDTLIGEPAFATFFALRDRDHLLETAAPIFKDLRTRHNVTHWYFIDPAPARTCFLRVHRPELHDDVINRRTLLGAIRTGDTAAGKELGQTAFALRVVRPFVAQGKLLGYMELGQEIDDFLARMKAETGDEFALVVEKKYLDEKAWAATRGERRNNWGDDPEVVAVDATSSEAPIVGVSADVRDVPDGGRYLVPVERGSRLFVRGVVPVLDAAGQRVGGLFVLHDVTALRDRNASEQLRVVLLIGAVVVTVLGLLFVLFEVLVFRRLGRMTTAMENVSVRLAGGDYDIGGTIHPTASDEIGRFEGFLGNFLSTIGSTLRELEKRQRRGG
ncbi:MAG TPA: cache domain-containing protein [Anaeromyxobacter sp.]